LGSKWFEKFADKIPDLKAAGLWGLEAYSSEINEENHKLIVRLAQDNKLVQTGGSDNHGTLKSYAQLGRVFRVGDEDGRARFLSWIITVPTGKYPDLAIWADKGESVSALVQQALRR
jgi:hypothetical protein